MKTEWFFRCIVVALTRETPSSDWWQHFCNLATLMFSNFILHVWMVQVSYCRHFCRTFHVWQLLVISITLLMKRPLMMTDSKDREGGASHRTPGHLTSNYPPRGKQRGGQGGEIAIHWWNDYSLVKTTVYDDCLVTKGVILGEDSWGWTYVVVSIYVTGMEYRIVIVSDSDWLMRM